MDKRCISTINDRVPQILAADHWNHPLAEFAVSTGLCVSLYGFDGVLHSGPHTPFPLGKFLKASGFWNADRPGASCESTLIDQCRATGGTQNLRFGSTLEARCMPAFLKQRVVGYFVLGWVPFEFTNPLSSERTAREIGVAPGEFWSRLREQPPVSDIKFHSSERMLKIISDALLLQLDLRGIEERRSFGRQILYDASQAMTAALTMEQIAEAAAQACECLVPMTALRIYCTSRDGTLNVALSRGDVINEAVGDVVTNAVTTFPIQSATQELLGLLEIFHSESDPSCMTNRSELTALTLQMAVAFQKARLFSDLTEERQRLDRTVDELRRMARLRDEFLATVSHELRTPLNAIIGWSQLLVDEEVTERDRVDGIDAIHRNAVAQVRIVEDLLDTSRIISGKLSLEPKLQDVRGILDAALNTVKPSAVAKNISLDAQIPEESLMLFVDAGRLQQIFWNLFSNAIKFTPQGGRVEIAVELSKTAIQFEIKDSGKGIKQDFLPYVFDRFTQEDGSTTRRFGGLGLGLAIVRHLTEMHGGQVNVHSRGEGFGATFSVNIPRPDVDVSEASKAPQASVKELKPLEGVRVVVVDDEVDARHLLMRMLSIAGAEVQVAASSPEALGIVEKWQPDLVIADICMPGEDGYTLLEQIRALPAEAGGKTPAFAVTAFHESSDKVRALKAGFQRHFEKPLNQQIFIDSLKEWVALH